MELFLEIVIFGYLLGRKESTYFNRQSQSWKRKARKVEKKGFHLTCIEQKRAQIDDVRIGKYSTRSLTQI